MGIQVDSHVDDLLRACAELRVVVAGGLRATQEQIVLLVIEQGVGELGMFGQHVFQAGLDGGTVFVGIRESGTDRA